MIIDSIATALDALYTNVSFAEVGEDYDLATTENDLAVHASNGAYWQAVVLAQAKADVLTYPVLLTQAYHEALGEADPNLKQDALLRLAATALSFAASVDRQTVEINAEDEEVE